MTTLFVNAAVNIGVGLALNLLFPPRGQDIVQEGPRLDDLSVTSAAYGRPINIGYGTHRYGGNVIWSSGIEEVATTDVQRAGKGGGGGSVTTTTYEYFASFAIAFTEGPTDDVLRMWADGKLILDKTGLGSVRPGLDFRFYAGNETQLPDPVMEAAEGVGNVSAHRGLCYIVFDRLPLADFGNRIPQITAELTFNGTRTFPFAGLTELPGMSPPFADDTYIVQEQRTDNFFMINQDFNGGLSRNSLSQMATTRVYNGNHGLFSQTIRYCMNGKIYTQSDGQNASRIKEIDGETLLETGLFFGNSGSGAQFGLPFNFPNGVLPGILQVGGPPAQANPIDILVVVGSAQAVTPAGWVAIARNQDGEFEQTNFISGFGIGYGSPPMQDFVNRRLFVTAETDSIINLWEVTGQINAGVAGPYAIPDATLVGTYQKGGVHYAGTGRTTGWCVLSDEEALIISNGVSMLKVDMNNGDVLATNLTVGFLSQDGWTDTGRFGFIQNLSNIAVDGAIARLIDTDDLSVVEEIDTDLVSYPDGADGALGRAMYDPVSNSIVYSRIRGVPNPAANFRIARLYFSRGTGNGAALSDVVSNLCSRAGLAASDIDVTDLTAEIVRGYAINRQGSVRAALEPLTRAFLFEGVESDWRIKFVRRGGSSVATIPADDVGLIRGDQEPIERPRDQEVELPSSVSVMYADLDADYQPGNQIAQRISEPTRTQNADNNLNLQLPVVFNVGEARQLAERLLYTAWAERARLNTALTWKYLAFDPTDIVEMQVGADLLRLRLSEIEIGADLSIQVATTQEDARSNISAIPGASGDGPIPQTIPSGLPTRYLPLDLPLLQDDDATQREFSRAYWAATGYDVTWPGAQLFQSRDNGTTYSIVSAATLESAWGHTVTAIADPGTIRTWDESSTIDVFVTRNIDRFDSATDAEVLAGANAIAVFKANGQPEIIQFVNVTSVDAFTVRLSRLLRGRRGTETNATGHAAGERIVLLENNRVQTFRLPLNLIDSGLPYRAVTLNTQFEDAAVVTDTRAGQDLVPFDPVYVRGSRDGSGNLTVTWRRRTRHGGGSISISNKPLNEEFERYELGAPFIGESRISATINGATQYEITVAAWTAAGGLSGELPLINRDFESNTGWSLGTGVSYVASIGSLTPQSGSQFVYLGGTQQPSASLSQEIDLLASGYEGANLDNDTPLCTLSYWHAELDDFNVDTSQVFVDFLNSADTIISSLDSGVLSPTPVNTWVQNTISGNIPAGTRKVRVRMIGFRGGASPLGIPQIAFDDARLTLGTGVPPVSVSIWQISNVVGRGRAATALI